jgi:methylamine dehydrogenase light chain
VGEEHKYMHDDSWIDRKFVAAARGLARRTSRRSFLTRLGALLVGAGTLPLLPLSRLSAQTPDTGFVDAGLTGEAADPASCNYWRHCSIDGFLSSCCGGTPNTCPPGTEMSAVTWIGTCRNPADDRDYLISYNDCCGNVGCGRCWCDRNEGDKPSYVVSRSNDINWCLAANSTAYSSTVALVLGRIDAD